MTREHDKTFNEKQSQRGLCQIKTWVPITQAEWFKGLAVGACKIHKESLVKFSECHERLKNES